MILYLSGPMTAHRDYNREVFMLCENTLVGYGYTVINPARLSIQYPNVDYSGYIRKDLIDLCSRARGICLVPNPDGLPSRGSLIEQQVAYAIQIPVQSMDYWIAHRDLYLKANRKGATP